MGAGELEGEGGKDEVGCISFRVGGVGGVDTVPDVKRGDAGVGSGVATGEE